MKTAKFLIISGRKDIDSFMKAADLFNGKNLGTIEEVTLDYKEATNLTLERAALVIPELKECLESQNRIVSLIHLIKIRNGDTITFNSKVKPYVDFGAREISDGKKSFVFKDFIERATAFKCKTDKNYYITDII